MPLLPHKRHGPWPPVLDSPHSDSPHIHQRPNGRRMGPQPRGLGRSIGPTHRRHPRRMDKLLDRVQEPIPRHTSGRTSTPPDRRHEDEVARCRPIHPRLRKSRPKGQIPAHSTRNRQVLPERTNQVHSQQHSQTPQSQHLCRNQTTSDRQCGLTAPHL
jgi:hypothetical protein